MTHIKFILKRFKEQGTLFEPEGIPDPEFSLPATLNWMRALAILVEHEKINVILMQKHCASVTKMMSNQKNYDRAVNTTFEQLLMSLHHLSSLKAIASLSTRIDTSRSAIVTWYYGIYHAASAMIAAQTGLSQEQHVPTANVWNSQFSGRSYIPELFRYRVTTLVRKEVEQQIENYRDGNTFNNLISKPKNREQAFGACMSYLKGCAEWKAKYIEDELLGKEMKNLGLKDFRTKKAKEIRDERLKGNVFGFIHQAFRFRGKANYREALFISYGKHVEQSLDGFDRDLFSVLEAFLCMAGSFCARRIGKDLWNDYHDDLSNNISLLINPIELWGKL